MHGPAQSGACLRSGSWRSLPCHSQHASGGHVTAVMKQTTILVESSAALKGLLDHKMEALLRSPFSTLIILQLAVCVGLTRVLLQWIQSLPMDDTSILLESAAASVQCCDLVCLVIGLTSTAMDTVVIFDPNWNPDQVADIVYRIGQKKL